MPDLICPTEADTEACGGRLAASVRPGDVIVLAGDLGAGKTVFTRGVATGLGVDEPVLSPSFVLARHYRSGFMPIVHVDVYRLDSLNEFEDLDVYEAAEDGLLIIEWGEAVEGLLPEDHLRVDIEMKDDQARALTFRRSGSWRDRALDGVM